MMGTFSSSKCAQQLLILLTLFLVSVLAQPEGEVPALPVLQVSVATHYDLGKSIVREARGLRVIEQGARFRDEIRKVMSSNSIFQEQILPYNLTKEGAITYMNLLNAVEKNLPQYLDEVNGIAFGAGLDFSELFLWNVRFEIKQLIGIYDAPTSSGSDICFVRPNLEPIMGHNEDGDTSDMNATYLIMAEIFPPGADKPSDKFTAFCYSGQLCGNAFGFTSKNLVYAANAVFPYEINTKGIARNFLARAVVSLEYDDVTNVLMSMRCASGFSLNIGDLSTNRLSNVEVSPAMAVQTNYTNITGYHFDSYLWIDVYQRVSDSAPYRLNRIHYIDTPYSLKGIRDTLGDTGNKDYPIFRTATPPDNGITLATGIFDFGQKLFYIYRGNPATQAPLMTLLLQ